MTNPHITGYYRLPNIIILQVTNHFVSLSIGFINYKIEFKINKNIF